MYSVYSSTAVFEICHSSVEQCEHEVKDPDDQINKQQALIFKRELSIPKISFRTGGQDE